MTEPDELMDCNECSVILGDWGTSRARLRLYKIIAGEWYEQDRCEVRGVKFIDNLEEEFFEAISRLAGNRSIKDAYLCGMIGSNIGWHPTDYISCPASMTDVSEKIASFYARDLRINIIPGLWCTNLVNKPDVMRGEETQIFSLRSTAETDVPRRLICLPGTHTKWVLTKGTIIEKFQTAPTGEIFEILSRHSTMKVAEKVPEFHASDFEEGLAVAKEHFKSTVLHQLFSVRSRKLLDGMDDVRSSAYLSGILIGTDILGAANTLHADMTRDREVILLSADSLARGYQHGLEYYGLSCSVLNSEEAAFSGLKSIALHHTCQENLNNVTSD